MKVIVEKREILGTLSTLVGRFPMLDLEPRRYTLPANLRELGALQFSVLNDEGYSCKVVIRGDFVIIPAMVPTLVDVKRVLLGEEAKVTIGVSDNLKIDLE